VIDGICQERNEINVQPGWKPIPRAADEVASILGNVSPLLNDQALHARLQARSEIGKFQIAIGATYGSGSEFLMTRLQLMRTKKLMKRLSTIFLKASKRERLISTTS
jgi:hypothetical protein